ncbi:ATP-binding protein, partial [Alteribacillus sp. JSM 102045]|uniref:ATP-binding protein n=1 Tax=Alteribacillus sp. JSM 102045 TaxID=1562101 RepID=UPI0035C19618
YEEFLALLLEREMDTRQETARYNRIRRAEFPYKKYIEDLSVKKLPEDAQKNYKRFERWGEIFQDPVMTAAMIDRLTHQAYIVNMNGNSYRMKETKQWLQDQQSV